MEWLEERESGIVSNYTENLNLFKPKEEDYFNIEDFNGNADIIDEAFGDSSKDIKELKMYIGYTEEDIYGVEVDFVNKRFTRLAGAKYKTGGDSFDDVIAYGGRRRCNVTDSGVVVAYYGDVGYSESGVLKQAIIKGGVTYPLGTKVQVMVEQPKFYYKVVPLELEKIVNGLGFHMRKARYYLSDTKKSGFKLHPAFIQNGIEKNYIYLAAYEGCTWDVSANIYNINDTQNVDFTNDILSSVAGAKPTSGVTQTGATRAGFRKISTVRGTGWGQQTVQSTTATELLFLIEYASFNMQTSIGTGVTNKIDDGITSMTEITGATTNLGNKTGVVTNSNGFNVISYRGEENYYGNIFTWVDGININAKGIHEVYIAENGFADNVITGVYKNAGITLSKVDGYISAFCYNENYDWLFLASETIGNSLLPVGDPFFQNYSTNDILAPTFGGSWNYGQGAGGFCWHVTNVSNFYYPYIGGRLLYIPQ